MLTHEEAPVRGKEEEDLKWRVEGETDSMLKGRERKKERLDYTEGTALSGRVVRERGVP